jgi:hypothetical protein
MYSWQIISGSVIPPASLTVTWMCVEGYWQLHKRIHEMNRAPDAVEASFILFYSLNLLSSVLHIIECKNRIWF